jgi:hypothetical protein
MAARYALFTRPLPARFQWLADEDQADMLGIVAGQARPSLRRGEHAIQCGSGPRISGTSEPVCGPYGLKTTLRPAPTRPFGRHVV